MRDPIINDTENCVVVSPAARTEGEAVYHQPVLASSEFSSDSISNWHPRTSTPHVRGSSCIAYTYTSAATLDTRTCTLTLTSQRAMGGLWQPRSPQLLDDVCAQPTTTAKAKTLAFQTTIIMNPTNPPPRSHEVETEVGKHKQVWSVSEHHLLDCSLRSSTVVQAIGGHRPPCQVASRLQMYWCERGAAQLHIDLLRPCHSFFSVKKVSSPS
ncbi:hypothetical protein H4582DRAFT_232584 [Lactarius indigo]|nr:hypothetical protein H4582DRAFT_232584 [Lactarius indigo]